MRKLMLIPVLWSALSIPVSAQCVMCFRTAKAQNQERSRVMNLGIFLLGAPPFLILAGFIGYVFHRDRVNEEND
jgi:hypothetical protein